MPKYMPLHSLVDANGNKRDLKHELKDMAVFIAEHLPYLMDVTYLIILNVNLQHVCQLSLKNH